MKTKSMNFIKKASVIFMLLAIFSSSCNKYEDDFKDLKASIAALSAKFDGVTQLLTGLANLGSEVTALQTSIDGLPNATALTAGLTALGSEIDAINTALGTLATSGEATQADIDGLQLQLTDAQASLDSLLANSNVFPGSVSITTDGDVSAYLATIGAWTGGGMINGSLAVNPALITKMDDLNTILKKVTAVVGINDVTITANATPAKALDLSNLYSVSGDLIVKGAGNAPYNLLTQLSVDISKLVSVAEDMDYLLDGPISLPLLNAVGGTLSIRPYTTVAGTVTGTTSINLPLATVSTAVTDDGVATTLSFPSATSIVMPATLLTGLTGAAATTVTIVNTPTTTAAGLTVTPKTTGATVDMSGVTAAAGALTVATSETVNLSNLAAAAGAVSVTTTATGTVNLDKFNSNVVVTIVGAKSVSLPLWTGGAASVLDAADAETITLPKHSWTWGTIPTVAHWDDVETLTLGAVNAPVNLVTYPSLVSIDVTGKIVSTWATLLATVTTSAANTDLESITLGGMFKVVDLIDLVKLTSITTAGTINDFKLDGAISTDLTAVTLGHVGFSCTLDGTPGSILTFTGNPSVETLTATNLDKVVVLTIETNAKLETINLPAMVSLANTGVGTSFSASVKDNKLAGTFTVAVAASPYVEATIVSPELLKLKPYVELAAGATSNYITKTFNLVFDVTTAGAVYDLPAAMTTNAAVSAAIDQTTSANGIDVLTELAIIQ